MTEEKLLWQVDQIAELGCGGLSVTGLALHGPAADTVADDPLSLSEEWYRLFLLVCERARERGLSRAADGKAVFPTLDQLAASNPEITKQWDSVVGANVVK